MYSVWEDIKVNCCVEEVKGAVKESNKRKFADGRKLGEGEREKKRIKEQVRERNLEENEVPREDVKSARRLFLNDRKSKQN